MPFKALISICALAALLLALDGASTMPSADARPQADGSSGARCTKTADRRCRKPRRIRKGPQQPLAPEDGQLFAPTSFWNSRLADNAPIDTRSAAYVRRLKELLKRWPPYVNTTRYSSPVYTVGAGQPTVRVTLDKDNSDDLQAAFDAVPIPPLARPADGSDRHMVVWQPATDTMWEFWRTRLRSDGWHALYGGRIMNVSQSPGHYRAVRSPSGIQEEHPRWGATATSLPLLGGLMRIDELEAGRVDHALAIALPEIRAGVYSWPAQRTDGESSRPSAIPEGARFRIDPNLDLSRIQMSPMVRAMAVAAQDYGIVVRDGAGAVTFFAEDPTPTGHNPFLGRTGLFGGRYISEQLRAFPWEHLQVLKTDMRQDPDTPVPWSPFS
jgi:hypothetical protein